MCVGTIGSQVRAGAGGVLAGGAEVKTPHQIIFAPNQTPLRFTS